MERRDLLRIAASLGAGGVVSTVLSKHETAHAAVRYESHGRGPALFLGSPISASNNRVGGDPIAAIRQGYLDRLTDRYQVIAMDYPPTGADAVGAVASFDPDRVCADILAVADAAGVDRFAWYGYSWGGVVGLQLAARTNRLSALICGGWPPIGASYRDMAAVAQWLAERVRSADAQLMVTFYRALEQWRDVEAVSKFTCPRMTFVGRDDSITTAGYTVRIGPLVAERQAELERMGWKVHVVDDARHDLFMRPETVAPLMRAFLDPVLLLPFAGQATQSVLRRVDHLVYAVPDLDAGVADLERRLGVRAAPGGQHPGRGTRNALIALGADSYLEILAPDPAQPSPAGGRWFGVDPSAPARLAGWAAKGTGLARVAASAAARGVPLGPVVAGSRQRPDGVTLKWTLTDPGVASAVSLVPFFIDWTGSPHPAATAPRGPVLESLRAEHPRPDLGREPLAALGIDLPVDSGTRPALVAVLRTVSGPVELR